MLQFSDPHGVSPQQVFNLRGPIVAAVEPHTLGRTAASFGKS